MTSPQSLSAANLEFEHRYALLIAVEHFATLRSET